MNTKIITDFYAGLSDLGKKLLIAATILIVITLFDRLLIAPTMSQLAAIDAEIAKEENSIKEDVHFLTYKDKILKEAQLIEHYLEGDLPKEDEIITGIFKKMEVTATKANVTLIKVSPPVGQQEEDYVKYTTDVECSGKLTEVITFMHLINSSDELLKVVKFNLGSKKTDTDEIKAIMTISKVIVSKKKLVKPANPTPDKTQADASKSKTN